MKASKRGVQAGIAGILAAVMLAGCGSNEGTNNAQPQASGGETQQADAAQKLTIMANYDSPDLSATDKKFIETIEQKNNVDLEFNIPPITGYAEKLQLMLSSGDYPDVVFFQNTTDPSFQNAVKEGLLLPVNDYIKNEPELMKYTYQSEWDSLKVNQDDKIYGIPRTSILRNDGYWVREDWLKKVGIQVPADGLVTIEQFEDILKKFTFDDPDGNGKDDTYGFAGGVNANKVFDPILTGAFGELGWQKTEGGEYPYMDAKYDAESTKYKDALAFMAKLYKEGVLDPDSATNDDTKRKERFWRGVTGVFPGFAAHYTWHLPEIQKQTPGAELTYIWVKGEDGKASFNSVALSSTGTWGFWAITKNAKDPQKAADVLNTWLTDDVWETVKNGYEGVDYTVENGEKAVIPNAPTDTYVRRNSMRRAYDQTFFIPVGTSKEVEAKIEPWLKTSIDTVVTSKDLGFLPEAAKEPKFQDYQKTWDQTIMKIIMGREPVDTYDELLSGWYKAGGDDYVKQMNEYIQKING